MLLPAGPVSSFLVISDPAAAKHVLRATDNPKRPLYDKGLVAEVSQFLFGDGFAVAGGDGWRVRRRAVAPSLHRAYLEAMIDRVFGPSALHLNDKLQVDCALESRNARGMMFAPALLSRVSAFDRHAWRWTPT